MEKAMTVEMYVVLVVLAVVMLLAGAHTRWIKLAGERKLKAAEDELADIEVILKTERREGAEAVELATQATEAMAEATAAMVDAVRRRDVAIAASLRHKQALDRQFHLIEDTCLERDAIWQKYRDQTLGAGNAQDLLFSELQRLGKFMQQKAKEHHFAPIEPSEKLTKVLGKFRKEHRDEGAAKTAVQAEAKRRRDAIEANIRE